MANTIFLKRARLFVIAVSILEFIMPSASAAGSAFDDFFSLEVGNEWVYQQTIYSDGVVEMTAPFKFHISKKINKENEIIEFRGENDSVLWHQGHEGITTPDGDFVLKYPLKSGTEWSFTDKDQQITHNIIRDINVSIDVKGAKYTGCIKVVSASDAIARVMRSRKIEYISLEAESTYCPNVGLVFYESFEVPKTGEKRPSMRVELISFRKAVLQRKK